MNEEEKIPGEELCPDPKTAPSPSTSHTSRTPRTSHSPRSPRTSHSPRSPRTGAQKTGIALYLSVLFAAAFLLLLLAYFMQQRTNAETLGSLKQSLTSMESLNDLIQENQVLHDEISALEDVLAETESELDVLTMRYEELCSSLDEQTTFERLVETIHTAEHLAAEKEYEAAWAVLEEWDPDFLTKTLASYDAALAQYSNGEHQLTPCYDALCEVLAEH